MIGHYFAMAFAKFRKAPFTTLANIVTLAMGLACFIAAYGVGQYWRSGDMHQAAAARTYVMGQAITRADAAKPNPIRARSTAAIGPLLKDDFSSSIENLARVYALPDVPVSAGANKVLLNAAYAEAAFMRMFDFDVIAGE